MKMGVYGLFSRDGGPVDPADRASVLAGIEAPMAAPGCLVAARDSDSSAADLRRVGDRMDVLLGALDEHAHDARALGLDPRCGQAELGGAAFDRWGVEAATRLTGDWLLVRWDGESRSLTLLMSECARDDLYLAVTRGRIAIAPELARLARLPWVDDGFDPEMLLRAMGRYPVRAAMGSRTMLRGVDRLLPGQCLTLRAGKAPVTGRARPLQPPPLDAIPFDEAMAQAEQLLRRIVRQRLPDTGQAAVLLSGGLDSSLVASLAAQERRAGQGLVFLSSAAPAGSGTADETAWAQTVAEHCGIPLTRVAPPATADIYAPSPGRCAATEAPICSPRHYLYDALESAAVANGATRILDGAFGELTVSNHGFFLDSPLRRLRGAASAARGRMLATARGQRIVSSDPLHVQAAKGALTALPSGREESPLDAATGRRLRYADPLGFEAGWMKVAEQPTHGSIPMVRYLLPFRDRRLFRMVAAWPAGFAVHDGAPRAMIRALLRGNVPDRIATRQSKMAFSPTYEIMLREQAPAARARIADQRAAGAGDWLDLNWLDASLTRIAAGETATAELAFRVQATAMAAEFLSWWHGQPRGPAVKD